MDGDVGRGQEENQVGGLSVDGVELQSGDVPREDHRRLADQAHQGVARMGQRDAIADTRAMELFALDQRLEERVLSGLVAGKVRHHLHHLAEHFVPAVGDKVHQFFAGHEVVAESHRMGF